MTNVLRVGLTGGIASGKSTVSQLLELRGAVVIDADLISREVVASGTPALAEIVDVFGTAVLDETGRLDRIALGRLVFEDPAARHRLEEIVHPRVRARAAEIEAATSANAVVVHDIPLLVETGRAGTFDLVIVVDVPEEVQLDRLTRLRGLSEAEARARCAAQATREERLTAADYVVPNDGSREQLRAAVAELWPRLLAAAADT